MYGDDLTGKTFGIWGLAFKPETDDVREAPALYITKELAEAGAKLKAYDPEAIETFKIAIGDALGDSMTYVDGPQQALEGSDALVICTEWNEFRRPNFDQFHSLLKEPVLFDGRNLYDLDRAKEANLKYISVGRPSVNV